MDEKERLMDIEEAVRHFNIGIQKDGDIEDALYWLEGIKANCGLLVNDCEKAVWNAREYGKDGMKKAFVGERIPLYNMSRPHFPDGKIVSWSWDFGDGETSKEENPAHIYKKHGTYRIMLTVGDDCGGIGSITKEMEILPRREKKTK